MALTVTGKKELISEAQAAEPFSTLRKNDAQIESPVHFLHHKLQDKTKETTF